jgi:hypothetical protein
MTQEGAGEGAYTVSVTTGLLFDRLTRLRNGSEAKLEIFGNCFDRGGGTIRQSCCRAEQLVNAFVKRVVLEIETRLCTNFTYL